MRALVGVLAVGIIALSGCSGEPAAEPSAAAPTSASAAPATSAAADPTSAAPVATPAAAGGTAYTVVQPKTLLGRSPATEAGIKEQGTKVGNAWGAGTAQHAAGAYGTTGKKNVILFAASTADIPDPSAFLDQVAGQNFAKYTFRPVDAGAMRGAARCADATSGATPTTMCVWADNYAAGIIYFFFGAAADAEHLLPQARAEIEVDKNK